MLGRLGIVFLTLIFGASSSVFSCEEALVNSGLNKKQQDALVALKSGSFAKFPFKILSRESEGGSRELVVLMGEQHLLNETDAQAVKDSKILEVFPKISVEGGQPMFSKNIHFVYFATLALWMRALMLPGKMFKQLKAPGPSSMVNEDQEIVEIRDRQMPNSEVRPMEWGYEFHASEYSTLLHWCLGGTLTYSTVIWFLAHLPQYFNQGLDQTSITLAASLMLNQGLAKIAQLPKLKNIPGLRFFRSYGMLKHRDPQMAEQIIHLVNYMDVEESDSSKVLLGIVGQAHVDGISEELQKQGHFKVIYEHPGKN
jgi:hypothetical protein